MPTRSQLRFIQRSEPADEQSETDRIAQIYRHSDGYPDSVLRDLVQLKKLLDETRDLVALVYEAIKPQYVLGVVSYQYEALGIETPYPIDEERLANGRIDNPTWLMIFPSNMVAEYGREWLLDLPAERIEELDDGAILICATDQLATKATKRGKRRSSSPWNNSKMSSSTVTPSSVPSLQSSWLPQGVDGTSESTRSSVAGPPRETNPTHYFVSPLAP
ncbi:hypothetical protein ACFQJ7_12435 [Halovenus rubra]|uniref:Uncharacterized protein n=2 Tax=Halovenus rubra TaxID=869890 RepID=A0ACC7DZF9_9EURY|nr:hypothetical protein [Halovenus rubra]